MYSRKAPPLPLSSLRALEKTDSLLKLSVQTFHLSMYVAKVLGIFNFKSVVSYLFFILSTWTELETL